MLCEVCVRVCVCLCAQSCLTPWDPVDLACQSPLSMEFSRQEYWSGLPFPTPGDLLDPGIKPESPASSALAGRFFTTGPATWETQGGVQHSQFTWAQNPFFLNISRSRVLWNTTFSNGMFVFNDFKPFIKGGLLARNFQVTILRGLKDWLCDCLLSLWESTPSLSTFYWQATAQKSLPQPSQSSADKRWEVQKGSNHECHRVADVLTRWQIPWLDLGSSWVRYHSVNLLG